jgi:signal transduction histidine kinase
VNWLRPTQLSLLWKILLSTFLTLAVLLAIAGTLVQQHVVRITSMGLEQEVQTSLQAYESLWRARSQMLSSASLLLSTMSDVRAAFSTGDRATIQDTAGELWSKVSQENAFFVVADPRGQVLASLGGTPQSAFLHEMPIVVAAASSFPRQATGFLYQTGRLYQVVVTPVYVQSSRELALLNVLVAGYAIDESLARKLKESTGGSDFLFVSGERVVASTLDVESTKELASMAPEGRTMRRVMAGGTEYAVLAAPLLDVLGKPIGELHIVRSFAAAQKNLDSLNRNLLTICLLTLLGALGLSYLLARRIVEPIKRLDQAASDVAKQNYDLRVPVESKDELGRLANTFNAMCTSIQQAREELIRQERISTIGRLSTSIAHDLRNPLAAIYGGAEMLVDGDLPPAQVKRLATNIYRASRRIQELLQDLINSSRGKTQPAEVCRLRDVITAAYEAVLPAAESQNIAVHLDIPDSLELAMERARMERVFLNLFSNALEAMPQGGALHVTTSQVKGAVLVRVEDTGPGIAKEIRSRLFQPFVSLGKKNGLGLGLALARQTMLDHGGDLWVEPDVKTGACFWLRLST